MEMESSTPAPGPERKTVEAWAAQKAMPAWLFAATSAHEHWASGAELTEAEFDAAVVRVQAVHFS
jgi:hypothetical protein